MDKRSRKTERRILNRSCGNLIGTKKKIEDRGYQIKLVNRNNCFMLGGARKCLISDQL